MFNEWITFHQLFYNIIVLLTMLMYKIYNFTVLSLFFYSFNIKMSLLSKQEVCHEASEDDNTLKSIYLNRMLVLTCFGGFQSLAPRWTEMCENVTLEYNLCSSEWECMYDLATKVHLGEAERLQMSAGAADGWSNGFRQQLLQKLTNEWPGLLDNLEKQTGRERVCHILYQNVSGFFSSKL